MLGVSAAIAAYDVQQMQAAQASPVLAMSPQMAAAVAEDPRARAVAAVVNNQMGPFGRVEPAEALLRSDVLFSQVFPLIDGSIVTPSSVEWWLNAPDNIVQSEEVVQRSMDGQVDFEIRAIGIRPRLNLGQENWDYLCENATFELDSTDQNLVRVPASGGILVKQSEFDTSIAASGFAADFQAERTLITGINGAGWELAPDQWKTWRRKQTLKMRLKLITDFTFPVPLTLTPGDGTRTTFVLLLFGRKLTDLKA
jgi:hypothetical protein